MTDFWDSPVVSGAIGGFLAALLGNLVQNWWTTRSARLRLLESLRAEADTAISAVNKVQQQCTETLGDAKTIRELVLSATCPEFALVNRLYAGWVVYAPTYPTLDIFLKLKGEEIELAIQYFDRWARLTEMERRYMNAHSGLLRCIRNPLPCIELTEICHQLHDYMESINECSTQLIEIAKKLRDRMQTSLDQAISAKDF